MPDYFRRYGFTENPFRKLRLKLAGDLLPTQAASLGLLLDIDGFSKLPTVNDYIVERVAAGESVVVVVFGHKRSGLSSAAAAVLLQYREARQLAVEQFPCVEIECKDHSEPALYNRWVAALRSGLSRLPAVSKEVKAELSAASAFNNLSTIDFDLQAVLQNVTPALRAHPVSSFGSLIEFVQTSRAIEIAEVMHRGIPAACVLTCLPSKSLSPQQVQADFPGVHVMTLNPLKADEVRRVLETRWGGPNVPFDAETFCNFCEEQNHTVGVALGVADDLIKKRVEVYERIFGAAGSGRWPGDPNLAIATPIDTRVALEKLVNGA